MKTASKKDYEYGIKLIRDIQKEARKVLDLVGHDIPIVPDYTSVDAKHNTATPR